MEKNIIMEIKLWRRILYDKRNKKGKEYNNRKLKYEGEYLNEKKMEKEKNIIVSESTK